MSPVQIHTLRACSLLVIPPPPDRMPTRGGFPMDLSELNLSGWATLVQDIAAGLQALPPNLGHDMGLPAVVLLQLLETLTGLGFCHYCCHLGSRCTCMGAYQLAPPPVVEPDSGADTRVWSDCLLWRHDHSWYHCSRDVWICSTSTWPPPSRFL